MCHQLWSPPIVNDINCNLILSVIMVVGSILFHLFFAICFLAEVVPIVSTRNVLFFFTIVAPIFEILNHVFNYRVNCNSMYPGMRKENLRNKRRGVRRSGTGSLPTLWWWTGSLIGTSTRRRVTCVRGLRSCSITLLAILHHYLIVNLCFSLLSNYASNLLTPIIEKIC